ncbi:hypothetical protein B296_00044249 [Ensete ventricosum]|uniref:Uncharacterized protein n=1 Tax=Ensete ventricosum TaxID=4639 RepID=A0A426ZBI1_ENSVE|nr:hypothetical protein B296_00044249 [Ensete ventricosum]
MTPWLPSQAVFVSVSTLETQDEYISSPAPFVVVRHRRKTFSPKEYLLLKAAICDGKSILHHLSMDACGKYKANEDSADVCER